MRFPPSTRDDGSAVSILEEPERFRAVAHQDILRLLVMIEHHFVRFPSHTGFFISAESRVCGIRVVAIGPYASGLDASPETIGSIQIARPNAGTQAVGRVVAISSACSGVSKTVTDTTGPKISS